MVGRLGSFFFCLGACSKDWESAVSLIPAREQSPKTDCLFDRVRVGVKYGRYSFSARMQG